ncbi:MAG: Essential protein Yae1, N terminal [Claussenomyces sp. TS43310]|nr:MAG: Essential protein Yae1, N terminal [Claussenomyces sp. TS43310]
MLVEDRLQTCSDILFSLQSRDSPSPSPPSHNFNAENSLDDIFGSEPSSTPLADEGAAENRGLDSRLDEPSDIPRMRSEHSTAGYRDGLTAAKGQYIQEGFDEGYSLGAVIGLRAGSIIGIFEGLYSALAGASISVDEGLSGETETASAVEKEAQRLKTMVEKVKVELQTEQIFGPAWWGEDGVWKFDFKGEDEGETTFNEIADAHPLIRKWEGSINEELTRFDIDLGTLQEAQDDDQDKEALLE